VHMHKPGGYKDSPLFFQQSTFASGESGENYRHEALRFEGVSKNGGRAISRINLFRGSGQFQDRGEDEFLRFQKRMLLETCTIFAAKSFTCVPIGRTGSRAPQPSHCRLQSRPSQSEQNQSPATLGDASSSTIRDSVSLHGLKIY
jgi:hypothetical protein